MGRSIHFEIDRTSSVQAYLQIKSQVIQLVYAGRLKPNDALPSVRALARSAEVAVGTVRQAYQELELAGIVEKRVGSGTYVRALDSDAIADDQSRRKRLDDILQRAIAGSIRLGFDPSTIHTHFRTLIGQAEDSVPAVFVGRTAKIAAWYADAVSAHLPEVPWSWRSVPVEGLADPEQIERELGEVELVFTYKGLAPELRTSLGERASRWEIVTVGTEVSASTRDLLRGMRHGTTAMFLAHERQRHLATVHSDSLTPADGRLLVRTNAVLEEDPDTASHQSRDVDYVIATLAMEPWLDRLDVPAVKRLLFVLDINSASIRALRQRFVSTSKVSR